ncbi:MAG: extracellular solute-binding protein [Oscillospiraceae bacterium]|nr:extracellular solute-binding protein [Oscillospiraceae bacterium]
MKKRIISALLLFAMLGTLVSGCNNNDNIVLTLWCAEMDYAVVSIMVEEFVNTHSSVKEVQIEICEDDMARETFESDPDAAPDVICIPHDQLGALAAKGYLSEITQANHINAINENSVPSIRAGQIDGKQYGFPSSFETHMLFYDRSIISDEAAKTLEGIVSSVVPEEGIAFGMDFSNAYFTANWFFTYGCLLFGENGEDADFCDFDSEDGVAAMTYLINNRDSFGDVTGEAAIELFRERKLGAFIGGPWNAAAITDALKGNYGCAKLPAVDGKAMQSFAGFKLYCVNAKSKNTQAAMDLAAWLTNPNNQKARFQDRNLIPVSLSLVDDADVNVSTTAKAVMAQGSNAIAMPSIKEMSNFWDPTGEFTLACYMGEIEISELSERLKELTDIIKGN